MQIACRCGVGIAFSGPQLRGHVSCGSHISGHINVGVAFIFLADKAYSPTQISMSRGPRPQANAVNIACTFERPKSHKNSVRLLSTRMFSGFKSRCTIFIECKYS